MKALEQVNKTREYLDYIERHLMNVKKAWKVMQKKCDDMPFIYDDYSFHALDLEVINHDVSKLSEYEFIQYRKAFYPTGSEDKYDMSEAWQHHKDNNDHHWETWTARNYGYPNMWAIHCAHMVIDWMAMGYEFNNTAQSYYEKNKRNINLPGHAVYFIYEIFNRIAPAVKGNTCE